MSASCADIAIHREKDRLTLFNAKRSTLLSTTRFERARDHVRVVLHMKTKALAIGGAPSNVVALCVVMYDVQTSLFVAAQAPSLFVVHC